MLRIESLKDFLSLDITDTDKALICLGVEPVTPRQIKDITAMAFGSGWRQVKKKNLSTIFTRAEGLAARVADGWELTTSGKRHVANIIGPHINSPVPVVAASLRAHLTGITDSDTKSFVEEAISCFEAQQYRAAVVFSWVGAVSILQNHVVNHKLNEFNAEAKKRNAKWKTAINTDDIGLMKEDTFLDILHVISVIGKNVKLELKKALTLRNGCGHPNSLKIAEHKASSHIEDLILNVYAVF